MKRQLTGLLFVLAGFGLVAYIVPRGWGVIFLTDWPAVLAWLTGGAIIGLGVATMMIQPRPIALGAIAGVVVCALLLGMGALLGLVLRLMSPVIL